MKVVVHPADRGGCGFYRLIAPAEALRAQGEDVTVEAERTYKAFWQPAAWGPDRMVGLAEVPDADVVVLQRPLARERYELVGAMQAEGIAVVVEIDDAFHAVHKRNPAWKHSNPLHDPDRNREWLQRAADLADLVTVTTPALAAQYGQHGRVAVLPNYVPSVYLATEPDEALTGTVIGWTGSVVTHPDDLQATGGAVADVLEDAPGRFHAGFHVVGSGFGVQTALGLPHEPTATGWVPLDEYPEQVALLDVGIVPLAGHPFNEAKSWLKGLEYAALGVPFVASPTGPYVEMAERYGLGMIVRSSADWYEHLLDFVVDPVYREDTALRYRETVAAELTVEGNAWRWWEAWGRALEHRQRVAA